MSSIKIYTADECDTKYFKVNNLSGENVVTNLDIDGTTLTVESMDPATGAAGSYDLTLPSGGEPASYCNSISGTTAGTLTYYNTSSGTTTGSKIQFKYSNYGKQASWSTLSITTSTTSSSWTKLGSFNKLGAYHDQEVLVKFKSSGDYGGVMITTQSSTSPSETNTGVIGIMTLPANRWGTYSFSNPTTDTYYIYGMACTNVSVKTRLGIKSNTNCVSTVTSV